MTMRKIKNQKMNQLIPLSLSVFLLFSQASFAKNVQSKRVVNVGQSANQLYAKNQLSNKYSSWGINPSKSDAHINLFNAWRNFQKKKSITVAVIDTGIDPFHPFLKDNIATEIKGNTYSSYGYDFSKKSKTSFSPSDSHGHGTHVSGIIKSVFPEVKILPLKYYNPKASGQENLESTIKALEFAVNSNVDIINYSGGGPEPALEELRILKIAERKGILVVAAAGNERSNIDLQKNAYYPASYGLKNIISVTAHNQKHITLSSSNYGKKTVDISAPGYRIKSALPNGRLSYMTGTSQATAFVTGVAALIKSNYPSLSALQVKHIIRTSAKKNSKLAYKTISGGKLDATSALLLAKDVDAGNAKKSRQVANRKDRYFNISK